MDALAHAKWSCGPMDKASAHGAGDCRFESDNPRLGGPCLDPLGPVFPLAMGCPSLEVLGTQRFLTAPNVACLGGGVLKIGAAKAGTLPKQGGMI